MSSTLEIEGYWSVIDTECTLGTLGICDMHALLPYLFSMLHFFWGHF